ncbi:MAG: family 1 glycosylhydrolase [Candidatus Sericytochromatia bacterium]|nr:family 1 glycosylhydrolase [Candidatus Sericytochromatia bacterium]
MRRILPCLVTTGLVAAGPADAQPGEIGFQKGFLWGVAMAAIQNEDGLESSAWRNFERAGRAKEPAGRATASWERYEEDVNLAAASGANAFRMSLEWSRIEPRPGVFDHAALARYAKVLDHCRQKGLQPIVTLYHFSYPAWVDSTSLPYTARKGRAPFYDPPLSLLPDGDGGKGWERPGVVQAFARYAGVVAKALKGRGIIWLTINEANMEALNGYLVGIIPPGQVNPVSFARALNHMAAAHAAAYDALHAEDAAARVSTNLFMFMRRSGKATTRMVPIDDPTDKFADALMAWKDDPEAAPRRTMDYIAFDYYYAAAIDELGTVTTQWRWPVHPEGMYDATMLLHRRYGLPLLVAENGMATHRGQPRPDGWSREAYLVNHVHALARAVRDGAKVIGYCYWTLSDNWEIGTWAPTFGLYRLDGNDPALVRHPTPAVDVFRTMTRANGVPADLAARYLGKRS